MRPSSPRQPRPPLNRAKARNAALLNQAATPGLGSLLAGHRLAGIGQLLLALAGFVMVLGWFAVRMIQLYHQVTDGAPSAPAGWLGAAGAATFAASWLWALATSLQVLKSARPNETRDVPPKLT